MKRHATTFLFFLASWCMVAQTRASLGEFKVNHFEQQFCGRKDSLMQTNLDGLENWCDTICTQLSFDFVSFDNPTSLSGVLIADQLNHYALHKLLPEDLDYGTFHDVLLIYERNSHLYSEETNCSINEVVGNPKIFSVSIGHDGYGCGAAHGYFESDLYHFNPKDGAQLTWDDFFEADQQIVLTIVAEEEWKKMLKENEWAADYGEFFLSDDFLFDEQGLHLFYDPYEIAPYAMGAPEILLQPKDFKPLLRKNGWVNDLYK
jgi:hypothetical protein